LMEKGDLKAVCCARGWPRFPAGFITGSTTGRFHFGDN